MSAALIKTIMVACRQLGLDEEARRGLQLRVVGKESLTKMSAAEQRAVLDDLKSKGFKLASPKGRRPAAKRGDVRFCHVLWRKLYEAGVVRTPGAAGLNAFVRARFSKSFGATPFDIDALRDWRQIDTIIQALKEWCARHGIDTEAR